MTNKPTSKIPAEARNALRDGRMVDAVRIVREAQGIGLKEAKDLVDAAVADDPSLQPPGGKSGMLEGLFSLFGAKSKAPAATIMQPEPKPMAGDLPAPALAAIQRGDTIGAIKIVREELGLGLAEAKQLVDLARRDRS